MKFLVIIFLLNNTMEVTFKMNQEYFICEIQSVNPDFPLPDSTLKTKVIDFKKEKEIWMNYWDSKVYKSTFDLKSYFGKREVVGQKQGKIIDEKNAIKNIEGIQCFKRKQYSTSQLSIIDGNELEVSNQEIQWIGKIESVFDFLPNKDYAHLLKNIYVGNEEFCLSTSLVQNGAERLRSTVTTIEIQECELPIF